MKLPQLFNKRMGKRGFFDTGLVFRAVLGTASIVIALAAIALALAQLRTASSDANFTQTIGNGQQMGTNLSAQLPTVGTMIGVAILIAVIFGALLGGMYLANRGKGGGGF